MTPQTRDGLEAELAEAVAGENWELADVLATTLDNLPTRPVPVLGAALWYAQVGLPVFPLQPRAKTPHPKSRGFKDATTDPDRITRWFTTHPHDNLGIATGHLVDVIDFDGLPGHTAWPFPTYAEAGVELVGTVSTPRPGGLHVYVKATGQGNHAGLFPGVDYRGRGGYVLAPPSVLDDRPGQHPGTYRFLRPLNPEKLP